MTRNSFVLGRIFACACACIGLASASAACSTSTLMGVGGETNWLESCDDSASCGEHGGCICGLCSESCESDDECPSGLVCKASDSTLVTSACGASHSSGICAPMCEQDEDCGTDQECVQQACSPLPQSFADASMTDTDEGDASIIGNSNVGDGNGPYIIAATPPEADCSVSAQSDAIMANGVFDIDQGAGGACDSPYRVNFRFASYEPGVLQLYGTQVTLRDTRQRAIIFDQTIPPLPNPFESVSSRTVLPPDEGGHVEGVLQIELVPSAYGAQLSMFEGQQLLAEINVLARDADGHAVDFQPFIFPIDICDRCLAVCLADLPPDLDTAEIYGDQCPDNAGADGRICIDPDC